MSSGNLRLLRRSDLRDAMELSGVAGWNQTIEDWEMLLRLDPQGCFGIEVDERIVATATLLCYGSELGWIGMVLTKPEYRREGLARRLMQAALDRAAFLRIESVRLDATTEGQPLYKQLGFETEQVIERWFREGRKAGTGVERDLSLSRPSMEMDCEAFGADRRALLQELAVRNAPTGSERAHGFSRSGTHRRYLGPCVARDEASARQLIEQLLLEPADTGWYWDLLDSNQKAIELANELGFVAQRRLERMVLGKRLAKNDQMVYAIAGFELG